MTHNNENVKSIMTTWSRQAVVIAIAWVGLCLFGSLQWNLVPFGINTVVTVVVENDDDKQLGNLTANTSTDIPARLGKFIIRQLPLRGSFPFDVTVSPAYEVVFLIQGIGNISSAYTVAAFDQFYCAILLLLCGQFVCLNTSLRSIATRINTGYDRRIASTADSDVTAHEETRKVTRFRQDQRVALNCVCDNLDRPNDTEMQYQAYNVTPEPGDDIQHANGKGNDRSSLYCGNEIEDELTSCIRHHQSLIKYVFCVRSLYFNNVYAHVSGIEPRIYTNKEHIDTGR
jgi:hypothetical protein